MKIIVTVKRVEDFEIKIKIKPDGLGVETESMKYVVNPFDEIAVEEALRLQAKHGGEVVILCLGVKDAQQQIRTALAMGADRGIHVIADQPLDPLATAHIFKKIVDEEKPDLVILGKQAVDDDQGQVGILLAEKLGWAQASFASKEASLDSPEEKDKQPGLKVDGGRVVVVREVDGGIETLSLTLPAVITTDLRLNVPRYASLPGIMKAKKKEVKERTVAEFGISGERALKIIKLEAPKSRKAGVKVADVAALIDKLHTEARVI